MDEKLGQKAVGEVQEKMMRMKTGMHMEKPAVALDYCNPHSYGWAEQGTFWVNQHTPVAYLSKHVMVLSTVGLLAICDCLNVGKQDGNQQPLERRESRCCLGPPQGGRDPWKHQADG